MPVTTHVWSGQGRELGRDIICLIYNQIRDKSVIYNQIRVNA
jgi:hypothetical protein